MATVEEAIEWTKQNEVRGQFCILVAGSTEEPASRGTMVGIYFGI